MTHSVRLFPDPVLRKRTARVKDFDEKLLAIVRKLEATMRSQPAGIGIAAPQLGLPLQIAVVDVSARVTSAERLILVNPAIIKRSEPRLSREGCMSLPEYTAQLTRFEKVTVQWQDLAGRWREGVFSGIESVCIQHEIDHLQGILIIDRVVSLKRDLIPRPFKSR